MKKKNYNTYSSYNIPVLDHIDLIAGYVHEKYSKDDPMYNVDTVASTMVIARFDASGQIIDSNGLVSTKWTDKGRGYKEMKITLNNVDDDMYFRLRGTNLGLNVTNETDEAGNPLPDALMGANNAAKAFADLWFYSNPVFVKKASSSKKSTENGIVNNIPDAEFNVFPNPVNDVLFIDNPSGSEISVSVVNLSGNEVRNIRSVDSQVLMNMNDFDKGMYVVNVKSANKTQSFKIVKN